MTFIARQILSFLAQQHFLYPGIFFGLKLTHHPATFFLMSSKSSSDGGARVLITSSACHVGRVCANDALFKAQVNRMLQGSTFKYLN